MNEIEKLQQLAGITPTIVEQPRSTTLLDEYDVNEDEVVDKVSVGHVDDEVGMIKKDLFQMGSYCVELFKMLDNLPDSDFPHWWQAKLTKASTYISDAKHYLENELEVPGDEEPVEPEVDTDDLDPSGVS